MKFSVKRRPLVELTKEFWKTNQTLFNDWFKRLANLKKQLTVGIYIELIGNQT